MNIGAQPLRAVFGEVTYGPGGRLGPRVQRDLQLVLIHRGEAWIEIDGVAHHLPAGLVTLLKPGHQEFFKFAEAKQTHHSWCAVTYPPLGDAVLQALGRLTFGVVASPRLEELIRIGIGLRPDTRPSAEALKRKLGEACLWEYFHLLGNEDEPGLPPAVERVRLYLQEHYAEGLDLERLAEIARVTPPHLIRLFRKHLHTTPVRYLWRLRLNEGLRMLRETGFSVSEVAYGCGFQSPFHFSRLVKNETSLSPKSYRELSWRKPETRTPGVPAA